MLGFLLHAAASGIVGSSISTIISYQSGLLEFDVNQLKDYVDAKVETMLTRKG